jgi:hypothetical protein
MEQDAVVTQARKCISIPRNSTCDDLNDESSLALSLLGICAPEDRDDEDGIKKLSSLARITQKATQAVEPGSFDAFTTKSLLFSQEEVSHGPNSQRRENWNENFKNMSHNFAFKQLGMILALNVSKSRKSNSRNRKMGEASSETGPLLATRISQYSPILMSMKEKQEYDDLTPRDALQESGCLGTYCMGNETLTTFSEFSPCLSNFSEDSVCKLKFTVTSFCITFMLLSSSEMRQKLIPFLKALPVLLSPTVILETVAVGKGMINGNTEAMKRVELEMKRWAALWQPALPGQKTDYFNHQACLSAILKPRHSSAVPGFDLEEDTSGRKTKKKSKNGTSGTTPWSRDEHCCMTDSRSTPQDQEYVSSSPGQTPREYMVYPAFLPSVGSSPAELMAHVGYRLASLSSLPPACNISRVKLAEAGFYYDTSKTPRNASNVHEVVCFTCGATYGQWKKGDNPVSIHLQIKPDCSHIRTLPVPPTTSLASMSLENSSLTSSSSVSVSGATSMGPASSDSGYSSHESNPHSSSSFSSQPSLAPLPEEQTDSRAFREEPYTTAQQTSSNHVINSVSTADRDSGFSSGFRSDASSYGGIAISAG